VKRLKAATIRPDGSVVIIGGRNAQGKTSLLDAILYAIGGKAAIPPKPLRDGETTGRSVVTLSNGLTATRVFDAKGSRLTLTDGEGVFGSPQRILDELFRHTFDPMAFDDLGPRERRAKLAEVLGIDFAGANRKRQSLFDERAIVNRDLKTAQVTLDQMPPHVADAPEEELNIAALGDAVEKSRDAVIASESAHEAVNEHKEYEEERKKDIASARAEIERLETSIANDESWIRESEEKKAAASAEAATWAERENALDAAREALQGAEAINRSVRDNRSRKMQGDRVTALRHNSEELTAKIAEVDAGKAKQLAEAEFPIRGLGFTDDGVTFNDQPWEQASLSERIKASVAMGFAINPKSGVLLIQDGSGLDSDSMALVANLAAERGGQVWIERVGGGDPGAIIIEDGEVWAESPNGDEQPEGSE